MNATTQDALRDYAGRRWPTINHKGRVSRLAGALRLGPRRVKALYYNEPGVRVRADEAERIAALKGEHHADADTAFETRISALEAQIAALRAELARDQLAADSRAAARASGTAHARSIRDEDGREHRRD